jgi:hypothetical protein
MPFDYKKEYKDIYLPKTKPMLIEIPQMNYIMVEGKGDPNTEGGEYKEAVEILYNLSFTIKMSKLGKEKLEGYFDYVVPPLEGLWWLENEDQMSFEEMDFTKKDKFCWISMIRQPEFVTKEVFDWAVETSRKKRKDLDLSKARFETYTEGLCAQIMHLGSYDNEANTIKLLEEFIRSENLVNDMNSKTQEGMLRRHHEIYLSDPRKAKPETLKTVIRHPVKR